MMFRTKTPLICALKIIDFQRYSHVVVDVNSHPPPYIYLLSRAQTAKNIFLRWISTSFSSNWIIFHGWC